MIKWTGRNTSKTCRWTVEAGTFTELYNMLVDKGIISTVDGDPYVKYVLSKHNKTEDDKEFLDADGELDYNKVQEFVWDNPVSDDELYSVIISEKGNAYYQDFQREENGELIDISIDDFDSEGNYKH